MTSRPSSWLAALAASVGLLLAGCATSPEKQPARGPSAGEAALMQTDTAFARAAATLGVAEAFYQFFAEDAVWLPVGSDPVIGRAAVRDRIREAGTVQLAWQPQAAAVARSGDLGYTWGLYESRARGADGRERISRGKYTTIWRKQTDGRWLAVLDIGNPTSP
jgi:ketosteroid isomerase-like protein